MPNKVKICQFKRYYLPVLTYGAGTCTWTKTEIGRLTAAEMRLLRSIERKPKISNEKWPIKIEIILS